MTSQTSDRIKETAKLRVKAATWPEIAKRYGYKNASSACTTITQGHPEAWREAKAEAYVENISEVEASALSRQEVLSRQSKNLPVAQAATHSLLAHCAKLWAQHLHITGNVEHAHTTTLLILRANNGGMQRGNRIAGLLQDIEDDN